MEQKYRMALVTHMEIFDFPMCAKGRVTVRRLRLLTLTLRPAKASPLTQHNNRRPPPAHRSDPMVFKKIGDDGLDAIVNVRLTSAEKERLRDDADMAALSMSALVRARYFGRPVIAHADQVMIKELRRLGGLLKHVHNESAGAYAAETSAALFLVSEAIRKVGRS